MAAFHCNDYGSDIIPALPRALGNLFPKQYSLACCITRDLLVFSACLCPHSIIKPSASAKSALHAVNKADFYWAFSNELLGLKCGGGSANIILSPRLIPSGFDRVPFIVAVTEDLRAGMRNIFSG